MLKYLFKRTHSPVAKGQSVPVLPTHVSHQQSIDLAARDEHIQTYHQFVDWPVNLSEYVHPAYLAMLALQQQAPLMVHPEQPFAVMGLVHLGNHMHYHRLPLRGERLQCRCEYSQLWRYKHGYVFAVATTVEDAQGRPLLHLDSHYLFRTKKFPADCALPEYRPQKIAFTASTVEPEPAFEWTLSTSAGRRYAALSGDYNPIHLWAWSARLLGLKRHIIHGMYSKAIALSHIASNWHIETVVNPIEIEVQFTSMISLPNTVSCYTHSASDEVLFAGMPYVTDWQHAKPYFLVAVTTTDCGVSTVGDDSGKVSG